MILLLVTGLAVILVLGFMNALSPLLTVLFLVLDLWALTVQLTGREQARRRLKARQEELSADFAVTIRHLGGLPLPMETPVSTFIRPGELLLEAAGFQTTILPDQQPVWRIVSASSRSEAQEALVYPPDDPSGLRVLSEVKERFRRNDRSIRVNRVLMLQYQDPRSGLRTAVFLTRLKPAALRRLTGSQPAAFLPPAGISPQSRSPGH